MSIQVMTGDCRDVLPALPAGAYRCCVTSPPYYGLRSYLPADHPDKPYEIGLEATPDEYIATLVAVFREVRRCLTDDGTLWVNIGDSYAGSWGAQGKRVTPEQEGWRNSINNHPKMSRTGGLRRFGGAKPKDMLLIPETLALALRADGWWVRRRIIWHKPNPMPESVTDRPTCAHEIVWMLAKSERYYYDAKAIAEQAIHDGKTRIRRDVWTITTEPRDIMHFALMPSALAELCILAGSAVGDSVLDPFGGAGTTGLTAERLNRHSTLIDIDGRNAARFSGGDTPMFAGAAS